MAVGMEAEESLRAKFSALLPHLDERQQRLYLGSEARALGHGGVAAVARAAGVSRVTVSAGASELEPGRSRRAGRGGPAGAASGPPMRIGGWSRRCWPWSGRASAVIRCRRCGGRSGRPATWRMS
jgi:hypothetical protein